jgi:hypothetical protein
MPLRLFRALRIARDLACLLLGFGLLTQAVRADPPSPSLATCLHDEGCFLDAAGRPQSAAQAYEQLHRIHERHYVRALLEESLFLGVGASWYWLEKEANAKDWDLPPMKVRFTKEVMRLDGNTFPINFLWHPLSGAAYYHAARSNDLGLGWSMLAAGMASAAWEYGFEFREKVSINDLIVTPIAGIALGEVWSRLGCYVSRPAGHFRPAQRIAAATLGPLSTFHNWLDDAARARGPADSLGYDSYLWHSFALDAGAVGMRAAREHTAAAKLDLEVGFVAVPAYLRPGKFTRFLHDADVSRLALSFVPAAGKDGEVSLHADTILAGVMRQDISVQGGGSNLLVGTSVGYRLRNTSFGPFVDDFGITHLPGLAIELDGVARKALLHVAARVNPDFVGIRAWPYAQWAAANPDSLTKTTLKSFGYTYGYGASASLDLDLTLPAVRFGAKAFVARYESIEGLARLQEKQTADPHSQDLVIDGEVYAQLFPIPDRAIYLELSGALRKRRSRIEIYEEHGKLLRAGASLGWEF